MSVTNCVIAVNSDDWYTNAPQGFPVIRIDNSTTILAGRSNNVFPALTQKAYMDIDTSSIPVGNTITSVVFYYYADSYLVTKGITKIYSATLRTADDSTSISLFANRTFVSASWQNYTFNEVQRDEIDRSDDKKTRINFYTPDPGGVNARTFYTRAKEYTGDFSAYLVITHAPPGPDVVDITKGLTYELSTVTEVEITKSLSYEIIVENDINKTLAYTVVVSDIEVTKSLEYAIVATQEAIQLGLTYVLRIYPYCTQASPYSSKTRKSCN